MSEHLKVLRKTGLLELEKDGRHWRYTSDPQRLDAVLADLAALRRGDTAGPDPVPADREDPTPRRLR